MRGTARERFEAKVDRSGGPRACHPWIAKSFNHWGYGRFRVAPGRLIGAHRYALEQKLGRELLPGMMALHSCDNPPCVNDEHLREGTHLDNMRDKREHGREPRGTARPNAHLTEAQVLTIREEVAMGATVTATARKYGINHGLVSGIVDGKRWAHVGGPLREKAVA